MSAEQQSGELQSRRSNRTRTGSESGTGILETPSPDRSGDDHRDALPSRIERVHWRARVAALERELAASERRRQSIVDQYERILDDRQQSSDAPVSAETGVLDTLRRLVPDRR